MTIMDNGDDRIFPAGEVCDSPGSPPCSYTTVQELEIDEAAKTATLQIHEQLPTGEYSFFGGNVDVLPNGNLEYTLSGESAAAIIREVTPGATPDAATVVWEMMLPFVQPYRGFRLPSLYPGVQWTQ